MLRLTEMETAIVKHYMLMPENIDGMIEALSEQNFSEMKEWAAAHGFTQLSDRNACFSACQNIRHKFWPAHPDDGFDSISIEDVAAWVLTTYLTEDLIMVMSGDEIIQFLQDWKYFFGFRKHEGRGELYRQLAFQVWNGDLVQDPNNDDIWYIERDKMEDML